MDDGVVQSALRALPPSLKQTAYRVLGLALFMICAYFFWRSFSAAGGDVSQVVRQSGFFYAFLALGALFYGASLGLLAFAWVYLLPFAARATRIWRLLYVYGISSIGKYLPGGFFHFGGRQVAGAQHGVSHKALAAASIFEAGLSVLLAFIVAAFLYFGGVIFVGMILATGLVVGLWGAFRASRGAFNGRFMAALLVAAFMAVMAGLAAGCARFIGGEATALGVIGGAYLAAWAVGFVAPGLSAGIGVREAAFVFLAAGMAPAPDLAAIALFMRLLTTLGDGVFFSFFALSPRMPKPLKHGQFN